MISGTIPKFGTVDILTPRRSSITSRETESGRCNNSTEFLLLASWILRIRSYSWFGILFGVKPLYYWSDSRSLIFSSELRPIRALVDDSIDVERLSELLRLRYLPAPDTLFKNIRKVRPGHIVEIDLGKNDLRLREYPYVAAAPSEMTATTEADVLERYGFLLEQAIQRQMLSDVEVGIL